jgi:hypothetical protein
MQLKSKYKSGYRKKKNLRKSLFIIISAVLFSGVLGSGAYLFYYINHKDSTTAHANENSITMYLAAEPIQHGQTITASMLVETEANAACDDAYYSSLDCIGQVAIVDIPQGMTLMQNMYRLPDVKSGDREVECEIISLSDNLIENDSVDVRLMLPNGEDYIVLAKKGVHDLYTSEDGQEEICYLWLSEEEILYYSAAVVDAYLYQGASLYTTKYIEPSIQEASLVTYVPSLGTITMMKENPNLFDLALSELKLEDRKLLENRLTDYLNLDIRERNWNVSSKEQSEDQTEQSENTIQGENSAQEENVRQEENATQGENANKESNESLDDANNDQKNQEEDKVDVSAFVED